MPGAVAVVLTRSQRSSSTIRRWGTSSITHSAGGFTGEFTGYCGTGSIARIETKASMAGHWLQKSGSG